MEQIQSLWSFLTLSNIKDVMIIMGSVSAIYIGFAGLNTWKKQLRGATQYDLARKLLKQIYLIENHFKWARSPFGYGPTLEDDFKRRLSPLRETWAEIQTLKFEAKALWGSEIEGVINKFHDPLVELDVAMQTLCEIRNDSPADKDEVTSELRKKANKTVYRGSKTDEFEEMVELAVRQAEEFLTPKLK